MVSKSSYQFKHRVRSLNTRAWKHKWCIWYFCIYVTIQSKQKPQVERTLRFAIGLPLKTDQWNCSMNGRLHKDAQVADVIFMSASLHFLLQVIKTSFSMRKTDSQKSCVHSNMRTCVRVLRGSNLKTGPFFRTSLNPSRQMSGEYLKVDRRFIVDRPTTGFDPKLHSTRCWREKFPTFLPRTEPQLSSPYLVIYLTELLHGIRDELHWHAFEHTVTYRSIARQRIGKHIPVGANVRKKYDVCC
jgi:hypothetical protein